MLDYKEDTVILESNSQEGNISNKCNNRKLKIKCYNSWDTLDIIQQEGITVRDTKELRQRNFGLLDNLENCNSPKIPYISHHIWFTSYLNPKEVKNTNLDSVIETIHILNSENHH